MKKLYNKIKKSPIIYAMIYLLILILSKTILNKCGYEYMSWIYFMSVIIIFILILIAIIKYIIEDSEKYVEIIIRSTISLGMELFLTVIVSLFVFSALDIGSEKVISLGGGKKYVKSYNLTGMHQHSQCYEQYNSFIRKLKPTEKIHCWEGEEDTE